MGVSIIEHMVSLYLVVLLYFILKYHGTILTNTTHPYKVHAIINNGNNESTKVLNPRCCYVTQIQLLFHFFEINLISVFFYFNFCSTCSTSPTTWPKGRNLCPPHIIIIINYFGWLGNFISPNLAAGILVIQLVQK